MGRGVLSLVAVKFLHLVAQPLTAPRARGEACGRALPTEMIFPLQLATLCGLVGDGGLVDFAP
jgi:hypothetical protein